MWGVKVSWELNKLIEYIRVNNRCAEDKVQFVKSVGTTIDIFEYHKSEAYRVMNNDITHDSKQMVNLIFDSGEKGFALEDNRLIIQANLQACVHNSMALYDIFSQLINYVLLNNEFKIERCDIRRVRDRLPESVFKRQLLDVMDSKEFKHIDAMVNVLKHRMIVEFSTRVCFVEDRSGVHFKSFTYRDKNYKALWGIELLDYVLKVKNDIVFLGEALNKELKI